MRSRAYWKAARTEEGRALDWNTIEVPQLKKI
jgi:hypothetical protein